MSKIRISILVLLVSAFLLATTVMAAGAASNVQFLGSRFMVGKGLALFFKVGVDYDMSQLASVDVNGMHYTLDCRIKEESANFNEVVCIAPLTRTSIGGAASIAFGPYAFSATIKDPRPWCYDVWDWGTAATSYAWYQVGTHCQVHTAVDGDIIQAYSPQWSASFDFMYYSDPADYDLSCGSPLGGPPDYGDGYYYDC